MKSILIILSFFLGFTSFSQSAKNLKKFGDARFEKHQFREAILNYESAIDLNPKLVEAYYLRGLSYYNLRDFENALIDFNKVLELKPKTKKVFLYRGSCKNQLLDYAGGLADLEKAFIIDPKNIEVYIYRGVSKYFLNDLEGSLKDFNKAIEINPQNAIYYCATADIKRLTNDYSGAMVDYTKSIDFDKEQPYSFSGRAACKEKLEDTLGAMRDYSTAIGLNPRDFVAFHNRGRLKMLQKDIKGAIQDFSAILLFDPKYVPAYSMLGSARIIEGDFERALVEINAGLKLEPNQYELNFQKAEAGQLKIKADFELIEDEVKDEGQNSIINEYIELIQKNITDFTKVITLDSLKANAYIRRGVSKMFYASLHAYFDYDKLSESDDFSNREKVQLIAKSCIADQSKAIELEPGNSNFYYLRSLSWRLLGSEINDLVEEYEDDIIKEDSILSLSKNDITKAIELAPENPFYYIQRAEIERLFSLILIDKYDEEDHEEEFNFSKDPHLLKSLNDYDRAIELSPSNASYLIFRADCKALLGDEEGELSDLVKALEVDPTNKYNFYLVGCRKKEAGKFNEALLMFDKAIDLDPLFEKAYYYRALTKIKLNDKSSACIDFTKSHDLGNEVARDFLKKYCK